MMNDMRILLAGIALIVLVGVAGFIYRNALERPRGPVAGACTLDAKICPDGTGVGRSGPSCEFAACPPPNTEFRDAGIAFVVPEGYELRAGPAGDADMVAVYERTSTSTPRDTIFIHRYPIPEGKTADEVMLEKTVLEPSGLSPEGVNDFSPRIIASRTFLTIVIERFEAEVHSAYYLPRAKDVLAFEVIERGVSDWTDPSLIVDNLPQHRALVRLLSTLDVAP